MLTVLVILLVALGVVVCLVRPMYAVVPVLVLFPLEQLLQANIPFLLSRPWIINVAVGSLALLAAFRSSLLGLRGLVNPVSTLIAFFYVLVVFGLLYTPVRGDATEQVMTGLPYWILLMALLPMLLSRVDDFGHLLVPFLIAGVVIIALLLLSPKTQLIGGRLRVDLGGFGGQEGSSNPLELATLGGLVAIVAGLLNTGRRTFVVLAIQYAAVALGLGLALLSGSRGQTIAAVLVIVVCIPIAKKIKDVKQFLMSVTVLGIIGVSLVFSLRYLQAAGSTDRWEAGSIGDGLAVRMNNIHEILSAMARNPTSLFVGMGTGAFVGVSSSDEPYPHNLVLETALSHGSLGLIVLGLIFVLIAMKSYSLWQKYRENPWERSCVAVLIGIAMYHTILSMKQGSYVGNPIPFWWFLVVARIAYTELGSHQSELVLDGSSYDPDEYVDEEELDG